LRQRSTIAVNRPGRVRPDTPSPGPGRIGFTRDGEFRRYRAGQPHPPVPANAARQAPSALYGVSALFKRSARFMATRFAGCTRTLRWASGISPAAKGFVLGGECGCAPCGHVPVGTRPDPLFEPDTSSQRLPNFPFEKFKPKPGCEAARSRKRASSAGRCGKNHLRSAPARWVPQAPVAIRPTWPALAPGHAVEPTNPAGPSQQAGV
jgi:hypothetical protein